MPGAQALVNIDRQEQQQDQGDQAGQGANPNQAIFGDGDKNNGKQEYRSQLIPQAQVLRTEFKDALLLLAVDHMKRQVVQVEPCNK